MTHYPIMMLLIVDQYLVKASTFFTEGLCFETLQYVAIAVSAIVLLEQAEDAGNLSLSLPVLALVPLLHNVASIGASIAAECQQHSSFAIRRLTLL
jgi:hypothetical protein